MLREFVLAYLKKMWWFVPLALLFGWLPPGPWELKLQGTVTALVLLLVVQLVYAIRVLHNSPPRSDEDESEKPISEYPTRRSRRPRGR